MLNEQHVVSTTESGWHSRVTVLLLETTYISKGGFSSLIYIGVGSLDPARPALDHASDQILCH